MKLIKTVLSFFLFIIVILLLPMQTIAQTTRLGGMDLDGYCRSQGRGGATLANNTWNCQSGGQINLTTACQWQYPNRNATAIQETSNNPYTWACYAGGATPTMTQAPTPTSSQQPTQTPGPTPTSSPNTNGVVIYSDALSSGWVDASYNATNTQSTTQFYNGTRSIASTMNADGGLDFQSINGQSTNGFTAIRFALRASQTNQQYEVYADAVYGEPLAQPVSLNNYGGQPTSTGWRVYTIPLADLRANNQVIRDFVIHEARSVNEPILYVDQVELISTTTPQPTQGPTPTAGITQTPTATPTPTFTPTPTPPSGLIVRRSIYALTPAEVTRLTNAINTLRTNGTYARFMQNHMDAMMTLTSPNDSSTQRNVAHRGPAFLPWHRAFLWEFEQELRRVDPTVSLPYWPFEQETAGRIPTVFSAAYFGGDGNVAQNDRVTDGPFASWGITRRIGRQPSGQTSLPTQANVNAILNLTTYDSAPYSENSTGFRPAIEGWSGVPNAPWGMHNGIHSYIGGDMAAETMATNVANDPIFFIMHADIDRIWWQWQQRHGITNYQPVSGGPTGHNLNDVLRFLSIQGTPADTLDIQNDMGYTYQ